MTTSHAPSRPHVGALSLHARGTCLRACQLGGAGTPCCFASMERFISMMMLAVQINMPLSTNPAAPCTPLHGTRQLLQFLRLVPLGDLMLGGL